MKLLSLFRKYFQSRLPFLVCVSCILIFYFFYFGQQFWDLLQYPQALIAPIMSLGSFVAGATFLGGGAVAFPALTKILGTDPQTAKTFSFAIQSVGMTSASFYILTRIQVFPIKFMLLYIVAATLGVITSLTYFQDVFSSANIRVGFTLFVLCFFIIYLKTHKNISAHPELKSTTSPFSHHNISLSLKAIGITLLCGFFGGTISGLLGSGADLMAFCLLTLFFHVEIKLATQLSVIIMAMLSIIGVSTEIIQHGEVAHEVKTLWIIAAPVVLLGAPLGAVFCRRTTSTYLIIFILCIVSIEVISTVLLIDIAKKDYFVYFICFVIATAFLVSLSYLSPHKYENR